MRPLAALAAFVALGLLLSAPGAAAPAAGRQGGATQSAAAGPGHAATPGRTGPAGVLLDVPFVKQRKNACGAASLAMVMSYWARQQHRAPSAHASQTAILRALAPGPRGMPNTALENYLRSAGFRTFGFSGRWSDLRENLAKGRPLIVGLGPAGEKGPLHYVVVAGIDWEHDFVFVNDPAERKLFRMDRGRFEREWQVTGNWTLLAVPQPIG